MKRLLGLNKQVFFFVALAWTILITLLSLFSVSSIPKIGFKLGFSGSDKIVHIIFYLVLTTVWHLYFYSKYKFVLKKYFLFGIALCTFIYGIIIEILQDVLPYDRSAEWADILANTLGTIIATGIVVLFLDNQEWLKRKN